jgi:CDP-4-dehydro-6-deoxyglucose reductase
LEFRDIAPEVRHFAFEAEGVERLDYEPGQFISISEAVGGKPITRAYSICSAPMGRRFELCLNRVPNGNLTPRLFELRPGDRVAFGGPTGHFVLRQPISDSILVATGTGIAPFRAMLQDCRVWASDREFTLIFGARYEHGLLYREEFEELARRQKKFRFWPVLSRPSAGWSGRTGYVQPYVGEALGDRRDLDVYVCGLKAMVNDVRRMLLEMGVDRRRIIYEKYD